MGETENVFVADVVTIAPCQALAIGTGEVLVSSKGLTLVGP